MAAPRTDGMVELRPRRAARRRLPERSDIRAARLQWEFRSVRDTTALEGELNALPALLKVATTGGAAKKA